MRRGGRGDGRATEKRLVQRGTRQGEVVEGDSEEREVAVDHPLKSLLRAFGDGAAGFEIVVFRSAIVA